MGLTERQRRLLAAVVAEHQRAQRPVGSRTLVELGVVSASASTIRSELGRLEELGLLEHPHTSAGRVPTDRGYREYVDVLLEQHRRGEVGGNDVGLRQPDVQQRLDDELERVTLALSEATGLLALATSPTGGAVVRHVEVFQLGSGEICTICITEDGAVARAVSPVAGRVDPGLLAWAQGYLLDRLSGTPLGRHVVRRVVDDPGLSPREREILVCAAGALSQLTESSAEIRVGGTPALLATLGDDVDQLIGLVRALDERRRLIEAMQRVVGLSASAGAVAIRIGSENDLPELRPLSVVGARYGAHGVPLGFVGLIGPRAMDYPKAVAVVAEAAHHLGWVAAER